MANQLKVYISSYGLYNRSSLSGKWWDVSEYSNIDTFTKDVVADLNARGAFDPEIMCQDYQNDHFKLYEESGLDWIEAYFELIDSVDADNYEAVGLYKELSGFLTAQELVENFTNNFHGAYDSEVDFAESLVEDTMALEGVPTLLIDYFDYEAYARDLFMSGYHYKGGYVFSR